ncbi:MAG: hypothetical protein M3Z04_01735 [Chloroflexota bacterium]|nr:hypothetical protein [Chloroflexota bacterium]
MPLLHPLLAGWVYPTGLQLDLVALPPADLEQALAAGDLDGGLVPPLTYSRLRGRLEAMPGVGLASEGPNSMVVLQSAARPDSLDGATVTIDPSAVGGPGPALLTTLARPYFDITLTLDPPDDSTVTQHSTLNTQHSVVLYAGDAAVRARLPWLRYEARFSPSTLAAEERALAKGRPLAPDPQPAAAPDPATAGYAEDLGAAWWIYSGTPMVWALGVVRATLLEQPQAVVALVRAFEASRTAAREQAATVLTAAAGIAAVPEAVVQAIFDRQRPDLDARAQGGLAAFLRAKP